MPKIAVYMTTNPTPRLPALRARLRNRSGSELPDNLGDADHEDQQR